VSVRTTRLVVEREIREAARKKAIWALVGFVFIGATAMVVLPDVLGGDDPTEIAVVGADPLAIADAATAHGFEVVPLDADLDPAQAVRDREVPIAVVAELDQPPTLLVRDADSGPVASLAELISGLAVRDELTGLGIDPNAVGQAFADAAPTIEPVDVERAGREGAAFGLTLVLYLLTVILTGQVASGVAVEKSNRVSEVLLAIVPPRSLLFGKVIGIGSIGLVTIIAGAIPVVIRFSVGGDLPEGVGAALLASSAWFVGGLALYLVLAGSLGALVSRQEEVGAVVTPLTMFLVVGYIISISAAESTLGAVLAYVPLLSPMVEPYRIAVGEGSTVEYVLSLVILMVAVLAAGRIGATVFRRAIVRTGRRLRLREVLTAPDR
jgi:ABC-2 type transport system permease protein